MSRINYTHRRFGRLTAIKFIEVRNKKTYWMLECDCGVFITVPMGYVTCGDTRSCGCLAKEILITNNINRATHGHTRSGKISHTWYTWSAMFDRCYNKKHDNFYRYGARGITVCKRWHHFENFLKDMGERPIGLTLDRKDNSKGYSKLNCRWSTSKEQSRNRHNNHLITLNGVTKCIAEWSEETGIPQSTIYNRLNRNVSTDKLFNHSIR